jgi:choline kinase
MHINSNNSYDDNRITSALLLAAGTGSRLLPFTQDSPKCLTLVSEISILARLVENLTLQGFKKLVVVTGHLSDSIEGFLGDNYKDMTIEYVHCPYYKTTNNIYSLWMARKYMVEPFVLLESDLVFDHSLLSEMRYPDRIAIADIKGWMNGTTVTINKVRKVIEFENDTTPTQNENSYKTVNIYSFSNSSWQVISKRLDEHIKGGKVNGYYETVFSELVNEDVLKLEAISFDEKAWYEIDTINDLAEAMKLFPSEYIEEINLKSSYATG